ncbi:MAG: LysR family transcriptional regulator [Pseudomonadota bacterium]
MHKINVNALDLNLLRVFDAVMLERNVTRAAERLYLSQPAVSHALTRLRHTLKDPLFVKGPQGMQPTPRAVELAEPINGALMALKDALDPTVFDPAESNRSFTIATHDYLTTVLMDRVAAHLSEFAPGVRIHLKPTEGRALEMLDRQEVELAISAFGELGSRFTQQQLFEDGYVVLTRRDHPLAQGRLTVKRFAQARHLLVSPRGDARGWVDTVLAGQGMTRQVAMVINHFAPAGQIVAHSDLVLTLPERVAARFCEDPTLVQHPCPLKPLETFTRTSMVWHRRFGQHPALDWLRGTLLKVASAA